MAGKREGEMFRLGTKRTALQAAALCLAAKPPLRGPQKSRFVRRSATELTTRPQVEGRFVGRLRDFHTKAISDNEHTNRLIL